MAFKEKRKKNSSIFGGSINFGADSFFVVGGPKATGLLEYEFYFRG